MILEMSKKKYFFNIAIARLETLTIWHCKNKIFICITFLAGAAMPVLIAGFATSSVGAATNIGKLNKIYL